jgi:hypothetical protein
MLIGGALKFFGVKSCFVRYNLARLLMSTSLKLCNGSRNQSNMNEQTQTLVKQVNFLEQGVYIHE